MNPASLGTNRAPAPEAARGVCNRNRNRAGECGGGGGPLPGALRASPAPAPGHRSCGLGFAGRGAALSGCDRTAGGSPESRPVGWVRGGTCAPRCLGLPLGEVGMPGELHRLVPYEESVCARARVLLLLP